MRKEKLFLHIGSHKTGTTRIQTGLMQMAPELAAHGIAYATASPDEHFHRVLGYANPESFLPRGLHLRNPAILRESLHSHDAATLVASSENFSYFFDQKSIQDLFDILRPMFETVQIIVYLRRQDQQIVSHHQETAKPGRVAAVDLFGHQPTALPRYSPAHDLYLDYEKRIGMWMDVFGDRNVSLRVFDRNRLKDRDALADFLQIIGMDATTAVASAEVNASSGLIKTKVGHMMNGRKMRAETKARLLDLLPDDPPMLPARADAVAVYERYRQGNARLAARLGYPAQEDLFSDDFSQYPTDATDDWDNQTAQQVIATLLEERARIDDSAHADNLRDAAILAQRAGRAQLAYDLISLALYLRPEGPFIHQKYLEIRAMLNTASIDEP